MKSLSALIGIIGARPGRTVVACALCAALLAGCAGVGLNGAGLAGPSWQQREALHLQEEGDDPLAEAMEETAQEMIDDGFGLGPILWVMGAGLAAAYLGGYFDDDEEDDYSTAFDSSLLQTRKAPLREKRPWQRRLEAAVADDPVALRRTAPSRAWRAKRSAPVVETARFRPTPLLKPAASTGSRNYYYCEVKYTCDNLDPDDRQIVDGWGSAWQPSAKYDHNEVCEAAQRQAVEAGRRNCQNGKLWFGGDSDKELPLAEDCNCGLVDSPPRP